MENRVILLTLIFLFSLITGFSLSVTGEVDSKFSFETDHQPPNVILIDIDRLTASRMQCYGYDRNTTPNMCEFGEENIMFKQATSQSGYTGASDASIFTSQYPDVHNLTSYWEHLPENRWTMAEVLRNNGYSTVAFPSYSGNDKAQLNRGYQLDQGFERYRTTGAYIEENNPHIIDALNKAEKPFFSFIQGWGPHRYVGFGHSLPNHFSENISSNIDQLPAKYPKANMARISRYNDTYFLKVTDEKMVELNESDITYMQNRYDNSMRYTDKHFGDLINRFKQEGIYSESIIILTANHGEILDTKTLEMTENRRFGHGKVYEDTHVPLMIHIPEEKSETVTDQVQLIDIFPTILDEIGIKSNSTLDKRIQGESLKPLYDKRIFGSKYESELAFSFSHQGKQVAARNKSWKLVSRTGRSNQLYNLKKDPLQTENVIDEHPKIRRSLESALDNQKLKNQQLIMEVY